MSAKSKIAVVVAIGALFVMANEASAQHRTKSHANLRHQPGAFARIYGYVPRLAAQYDEGNDVYYSHSLGRQSFPNPDRDFSIQNLSSHFSW